MTGEHRDLRSPEVTEGVRCTYEGDLRLKRTYRPSGAGAKASVDVEPGARVARWKKSAREGRAGMVWYTFHNVQDVFQGGWASKE